MWVLTVLEIVVKRRRMVILSVTSVTILAIIISLILPRKYGASCTILPPQEESPIAGLLGSAAASLSQAAAGFALPFMATPSDLYARMMESETVLSRAVDTLNLIAIYDKESRQQAVAELREQISTQVSPEGIVKLDAKASSPALAADIANTIVSILNSVNSEIQSQKNRIFGEFLSLRVQETTASLKAAQDRLLAFQRDNLAIALDAQTKAMIDILAQQQSELTAAEIEQDMLRLRLNPGHPELAQLSLKIGVLRGKLRQLEMGPYSAGDSTNSAMEIPLSRIPDLAVQYSVLMRDVKVQELTYELLYQQLEVAQMQAKKDVPTVAILDRAIPPEEAIWPRKRIIAISSFLLSLLFSVGAAVVLEKVAVPESTAGKTYGTLLEYLQTVRRDPLGKSNKSV